MADEDLKLNDIPRFSKSSRNLVLREYNNCEVPAGCGGVVFRWKKPDKIVAFQMDSFILGEFKLLIDGTPPQSACTLLERGKHILSLVISDIQSSNGLLLFVGKSGESGKGAYHERFHEGDRKERVLSLPDSSWNYSLSPPMDESWTNLKFDDSTWKSMISKGFPPIYNWESQQYKNKVLSEWDEQDFRKYKIKELSEQGARSLGIEEDAQKSIWIRKTFSL